MTWFNLADVFSLDLCLNMFLECLTHWPSRHKRTSLASAHFLFFFFLSILSKSKEQTERPWFIILPEAPRISIPHFDFTDITLCQQANQWDRGRTSAVRSYRYDIVHLRGSHCSVAKTNEKCFVLGFHSLALLSFCFTLADNCCAL